ncbi:rod shape-determining protein MreC [uncultured Jatrophihabitans sp.]|uniref:rod shape-determining protein MreC n=1 Tax=uncultured Jatrophihabitans sp. TaxID=1610747 RepID=UPI0035CA8553
MRQLTRRQRTSALVLAVVALCFITLDLGGGSLREAHSGVRGSLGSLYRGTDAVLGPARQWLTGLPTAGSNQSRIDTLQHRNTELQARLNAQASDRRTSSQLAALQRAADGTDHTVLPARVVAFGPGQGFDWTVTVDVGTADGARDGQTVTDGAGLVGRVLHADGHSAVVLLAADPGSGVGVRDTRTGEIGVATGNRDDGLVFQPLDPDATVRTGDRLITGPGGSSSYVAGLSVGTVTAVHASSDGATRATVRPTSSPTAVDLVGVITEARSAVAGRNALTPSGR